MFKTVLWATDGSEAAERALPFAKSLATAFDGALAVVHVKELMIGRAGGYPVLADEEELEARIRAQVDELRAEGFDATFKLVTRTGGHAAHVIAEHARELGADVIVVGTRGYSPVPGLLLGSITQRLLHIAPCPVFAVPASVVPVAEMQEAEAAVAGR
jgi:nucleotide-binding universal stress UspA family protein